MLPDIEDNILRLSYAFHDPEFTTRRCRSLHQPGIDDFVLIEGLLIMWYERDCDEETTQTTKTQAGAL